MVKYMPKKGELVYRRKDGLWEARYVKEIDAYGKRKYGSVYAHSCKDAKEKRQVIIDNIRLCQSRPVSRNMTIEHLANEYLYVCKNRIKESTYQRYEGLLKNHFQHIGKQPIIYINTAVIHEFALNRLGTGMKPQSVNAILVFLHSCLKYGQRQYNFPLPEVLYLPVTKKEMRVLSIEEQKKLTTYLYKEIDVYKFGILLALYTGIRIGELCGLKWEDFDDKCIKIKRTVQRLKGDTAGETKLFIGTPKTNTSIRTIPIPCFFKETIEMFKKISNEEYVLGTSKIHLAEPRILQWKFKKYLIEADIEKANFHSLRHTFATRSIECGCDVKSLSEILGHSSVQTTLNKYVHSSFKLKSENINKLAQFL